MQSWLNRVVQFSVLFAFVVILLGAYTRLKDAGLGCPDWPGCYGQLIAPETTDNISKANSLFPETPVETAKAKIEMTHRYFASTLGLLIIGLLFLRTKLKQHSLPKWLPIGLLGLVIFQGILGMWTVTLKLLPMVVMGHLLGGFAILSMLWLSLLHAKCQPIQTNSNAPTKIAKIALLVVIFQIFLGGWTSANYAAIICPDFPACQGHIWPPAIMDALKLNSGWGAANPSSFMNNDARVSVQLLHRFGALATTVSVACLSIGLLNFTRLQNNKNSKKILYRLNAAIISILCLQIFLGLSNVLFLTPLPVAVMHNGVGALLLLAIISVNYFLRKNQNQHAK
jgi:cytochrome c oxidase assembly protein subunit 15